MTESPGPALGCIVRYPPISFLSSLTQEKGVGGKKGRRKERLQEEEDEEEEEGMVIMVGEGW